MLGMVAGGLGAVRACGPGVGKVRALDRKWRWTVGCLLDKVGTASSSSSLLSTMGWQGWLRLFTIDGNGKLTGVLVLG